MLVLDMECDEAKEIKDIIKNDNLSPFIIL